VGGDDVGLDRGETVVIQSASFQRLGEEVRDDDVARGDKLAQDLAALWMSYVEREGALVVVHLQEERTLAVIGDRHDVPVGIAVNLLDANAPGAQVAQHGRAVRRRNEASEIQHANACEDRFRRILSIHYSVSLSRTSAINA